MRDAARVGIYAELHPNLRQVSVAVTLPSAATDGTSARLTEDGAAIQIRHEASTVALRLPAPVEVRDGGYLPLPFGPPRSSAVVEEASWRLPLAPSSSPQPSRGRETAAAGVHGGEAVPWSAADLVPGSGVRCRSCEAFVVPASRLAAWKDLPSENWAEMMDFWHCHKPDTGPREGEPEAGIEPPPEQGRAATQASLAARGYGASSTISAQRGVGLVDLMALSFAEDDCLGVTFSRSSVPDGSRSVRAALETHPSSLPRSVQVFCVACRTRLGHFHFDAAAVALFKWQVLCEARSSGVPSIQDCLAAALTATIARSGSSTVLLLPTAEPRPDEDAAAAAGSLRGGVLHLWVLNSSIRYASSGRDGVISAVKLLFRTTSSADAERLLEKPTTDAQEMTLPAEAIVEIRRALADSCMLLPVKDRVYKEWQVALLDRWAAGGR